MWNRKNTSLHPGLYDLNIASLLSSTKALQILNFFLNFIYLRLQKAWTEILANVLTMVNTHIFPIISSEYQFLMIVLCGQKNFVFYVSNDHKLENASYTRVKIKSFELDPVESSYDWERFLFMFFQAINHKNLI